MALGALLTFGAASPASAQTDFHWRGDTTNNHWDRSENWSQDPGAGNIPDSSNDNVLFNDNASRFNIDLSDRTRDVGTFTVATTGPNHAYRLFNGTLRFNNTVSVTTTGLSLTFDEDLTVRQMTAGTWSNDSGDMIFQGPLIGTGAITLNSGVAQFNGLCSYSGTFTISDTGLVRIGADTALQYATINTTVTNGLDLNGHNAVIGGLSGSGDQYIGTLTLTFGGAPGNNTYSGKITGAGGPGPRLIKTGGSGMIMSGIVSNVESFEVAGGAVEFHNNMTLHDPTSDGALRLSGGDFGIIGGTVQLGGATPAGGNAVISDNELAVLGGQLICGRIFSDTDGIVALRDNGSTPALVIGEVTGDSASSSTFAGRFVDANGPGSVRKIGDGTLTLNNDNLNTGGFEVEEGAIGGSGRVRGTTHVYSGAAIKPGSSAGVFTVQHAIFDAGSTLEIELGGAAVGSEHDMLYATGDVTLGGTLDLSYINSFVAAPGDSFVVVKANSISGQFDAINFPDGQTWNVVYNNATGVVSVNLCSDPQSGGCADCADGEPIVQNITKRKFYATIQGAIDAADFGDTLELNACVFHERNLSISDKSLTLRGLGADATFIDGDHLVGSIIQLSGSDASTFQDLTIRNGVAHAENGGGAVRAINANVTATFRNVVFDGNDSGGSFFGAIYLASVQATFDRCIFRNNVSTLGGGASAFGVLDPADVTFTNCLFENEHAVHYVGYVQTSTSGAPDVVVSNCTFINGDCQRFLGARLADAKLSVFNCAFDDTADALFVGGGAILTSAHCVYPGATGDDIDGVPTFVDAANGDYRLAPGSLGIDAGDHDAYLTAGGDAMDLGGDDRLVDDACETDSGVGTTTYLDVGAYEYQADNTDTDSDGVPDVCDACPGFDDSADADGDGIPNGCDACPGSDDALDNDSDSVPDGCDVCPGGNDTIDSDGDGVPDACDNCPNTPNVRNVTQNTVYATIQAAVSSAVDGDVIELGACTFHESLIMLTPGVNLTISGQGYQETTIDCGGPGPVFIIDGQGVVNESVIEKMNILGVTSGVGVAIGQSDAPTLHEVWFSQCSGTAVVAGGDGTLLDRCGFIGNDAAAGVIVARDTLLRQCVMAQSTGPQVRVLPFALGIMINCTVNATNGVLAEPAGDLAMANTIVKGPVVGSIFAEYCMYAGATGNSINVDPVLSDSIHLVEGSPAIDAASYVAFDFYGGGAVDALGETRLLDDLGTANTGLGDVDYLDIGAVEFDGLTDTDNDGVGDALDVCPNRRPGDMDGDHGVDADDVMLFVQVLLDPNFGTPDERCAADNNLDTLVNGDDVQPFVERVLEP